MVVRISKATKNTNRGATTILPIGKGQGLGFGVWGLGFGVWGLGFGVSNLIRSIVFPLRSDELCLMVLVLSNKGTLSGMCDLPRLHLRVRP